MEIGSSAPHLVWNLALPNVLVQILDTVD